MNLNVKFTESNNAFAVGMSSSKNTFGSEYGDLYPVSGPPGKSAYEVALNDGFEGTEAEWLESLKGPTGMPGKDGIPGQPGKDGYTPIKGVDYFDGADGKIGADGKDGYSPVRGVDYWTPDDKAEIKSYVDEAILGGEW